MKLSLRRITLIPLAVTLLAGGTQCGKKEDASAGSAAQTAAPQLIAPVKPPSMVDHAAKLDFAAKLPQETEFYLGSVNLKSHLEALKTSLWWKDINAIVQDKTPAPTAGDKSLANLQKVLGDDMFIAGGQGFAASANQLRNFNHVYNEVYFKMLMSGGAAGALGTNNSQGNNPMMYLQMFLQDPATLEKVATILSTFELPPLLAGFKVEKPEEILSLLDDTKQLEEKKIFVMSDFTTSQGQKFRVATIDMANLMPEADQQSALEKLPKDTPEASRKIIEKAYDDLQGKKFQLAWGAVDGHVILACGKNLDHLKFATDPTKSLLAKPELAWLMPHASKNLLALTYASAASIEALNDEQPFVPMLRGATSAMKESPMFKGLGDALEKQIAELSPLEAKVYDSEATNLIAAAWWDQGFHAEFTGGIKPKFLLPDKPLQFLPILNQPGVVFALDYHRNREHEQAVRAWLEKLISVAYTAAQELIKAGIAGPNGGQSFAMFELMLLPTIKSIYQADRDIDEKGLGSEIAYVLDVNGKMPQLPGVPSNGGDLKFPRIAMASDVANRGEVAKGWKTINDTVNSVAALVGTFTAGQQPDGQPKPPFMMPAPVSSQAGDRTSWFYTGELFNGDLNPCACISDKLLVLSSSKDAAEAFAAEIAKPSDPKLTGAAWKFDLSTAADWIAKASTLNTSTTPDKAKEVQQGLKWIRPFHAMEGRIYQDKGEWQIKLDWKITDIVKFD